MISLLLLLWARHLDVIHVTVDGVDRMAQVFPPALMQANPPVIFCFHGHGGNASQASRSFKMQRAWPDALVIYPEGLPTPLKIDPQGRQNGWVVAPTEDNRDIKFFDALYAKVMADYHADPNRVFAMGHSNGAMFMYTLWGLRGDKFAGLGSCEGFGAGTVSLTPKPFFITIGSNDQIVPTRIQEMSLGRVKKVNGSSETGTPYGEKGTLFSGVKPVVFWSYQGGHAFPADCVPTMVQFFKGITS